MQKQGTSVLLIALFVITLHNHQTIVGAKKLITQNKLVIALSIAYQEIVIGIRDIQNEDKFLHSSSSQYIKKLQWKNNKDKRRREEGKGKEG